MPSLKVLILYNEPVLPADHPDYESEHEVLDTATAVETALTGAGYGVSRLGLGKDPALLIDRVRQDRPDVVFNLFEGLADHTSTETHAAGLLDWLGIPFTGSPFQALTLARHKHLTKYLFQGAGLPTPRFLVVDALPVPACDLGWPVIVKPALQDASVGIDHGSVVTDAQRLHERVALMLERYGPPVLVEEFIRGRELNVALIEAPDLRTLPISEVLFTDPDPQRWPIITYEAKWDPDSRDFDATPPLYPAQVEPELAVRLETLSRQAFRVLGCRDYARVDFRVRPSGEPYLLEVNPNPDFNPDAGLSGGLYSANMTHAQFAVQLVHNALARTR